MQLATPDFTRIAAANARPRALVVEDEQLITELLSIILDDDYQVVCVAEAEAAIAELNSQHVDFSLPGGNGCSVASQARENRIPVVWMTGDTSQLDGLNPTKDIIIAKPFHIDGVLKALLKARQLT